MNLMTNDIQTIRTNIAEAVHRAVCDFTESDGCGRCFHYALAGWVLANSLVNPKFALQAGKLYIVADPPDGAVAIEPGQYGFQRGEFHCWFARPGNDGKMAEFVDLSSRHYRRLVEQGPQVSDVTEMEGAAILILPTKRIRWTRNDNPPKFIWTDGTFPDVMQASPTEEATNYLYQAVKDSGDRFKPLVALAWKKYRELTDGRC